MDIQKEIEVFKVIAIAKGWDVDGETTQANYRFHCLTTQSGWEMWQAAKVQVPEGSVLVPKADLESWHYWDGDSDNMYRNHYSESICDDVELGAVFEIEEKMAFKTAPIYVVPIYSDLDDYEYEEFESEELANKAAAENKAMIEAQENE